MLWFYEKSATFTAQHVLRSRNFNNGKTPDRRQFLNEFEFSIGVGNLTIAVSCLARITFFFH